MMTFRNELLLARPETHRSPMKMSNVMGRGAASAPVLVTSASSSPAAVAPKKRRETDKDTGDFPSNVERPTRAAWLTKLHACREQRACLRLTSKGADWFLYVYS